MLWYLKEYSIGSLALNPILVLPRRGFGNLLSPGEGGRNGFGSSFLSRLLSQLGEYRERIRIGYSEV